MAKQKKALLIYAQIILANVFWGFSFVWTDVAIKAGMPPVTIVLSRLVCATILLGIWAKYTNNLMKIRKGDIKYFLGLATCEPFFYFLCETYGQTMVSPTVTSIIVATIPLFTSIVAFWFLKEKISLSTIFGIIISLIGVTVVIICGNNSLEGQFWGTMLVFGAVLSALGYSVFIKMIISKYNATTLVFSQNLVGLFLFLPLFFIIDLPNISNIKLSISAITAILQLSVFASVMAFIFYSRAVNYMGIAKAGVFSYLIPVLTAMFSFFVVNEILTFAQWSGIGIVILGLFLSQIVGKEQENCN